MQTKRCPKCETTKPLSMFGKDRTTVSGIRCHCRHCSVIASGKWKRTERGKRMNVIYVQEHNRRNPGRYRARKAVKIALKGGRLIRGPCETCNDPKTDAHHDDYRKLLSVRWLCKKHHAEAHAA